MGRPTEPVILDRQWDVSSLLGETFKLFFRHAPLFLTVTAVVVVPLVVAMDVSLEGAGLEEGDTVSPGALFAGVLSFLLTATVAPALVTALHVVALLRIAEGERPGIGEALRLAARRAGPAIGASVLYFLAIVVGFVLLIIPGIWLSIRLYFAAQAAVVDDLGPADALRRSAELVKDRWWQTFGRLLLAAIVFALVTIPLTATVALIDYGVLYVALDAIAQTVALSLTALFGTLVFMDYHGHRPQEAATPEPAGFGGFDPPRSPPQTFG